MSYDNLKIGDLFSEEYFNKNLVGSKALNVLYSTKPRNDLIAQDINVKNTGINDISNVYEIVEPNISTASSSYIYDKAFKNNEVFNISYSGIIINSITGAGNQNIGVLGVKNNSNKDMYINSITYHAKLKNGNTKEGISAVGYTGCFGNFTNDSEIVEDYTIIKRGATLEYDLNTNIELFRTNDNNVDARLAFGAHQVNFSTSSQNTNAEPSEPTIVRLAQPILVKPQSVVGVLTTNTTVFNAGVDIQASIDINGYFANKTDF